MRRYDRLNPPSFIDKLVGKLAAAHTVLGSHAGIDHATAATYIQQWIDRRG
jgi:hypothetical protein